MVEAWNYAADPERLSRFHREAQAVAALNHTSIAAIYDFADADGTKFLVLELIEGETLADRAWAKCTVRAGDELHDATLCGNSAGDQWRKADAVEFAHQEAS